MEQLSVEVQGRKEMGSSKIATMRKEGRVPAVIYSRGEEAKHLSLDELSFRRVLGEISSTQLFRLQSEDSDLNGAIALIKSVQREPIKDNLYHVDFYQVHEGNPLKVTVPVVTVGESTAVRSGIAVMIQFSHHVKIECLPEQIPQNLEIDVSELKPGDTVYAESLKIPEGAKLLSSERQEVLGIRIGRLGRVQGTDAADEGGEATGAAAEAPEAAAS